MEAESFDKKIRELLNSQEFPYADADWQKAQQLLVKERRRRGFWWLWLLPVMVGGTTWWMVLVGQPESTLNSKSNDWNDAGLELVQALNTKEITQKMQTSSEVALTEGSNTSLSTSLLQHKSKQNNSANKTVFLNEAETRMFQNQNSITSFPTVENTYISSIPRLSTARIQNALIGTNLSKKVNEPLTFDRPALVKGPMYSWGIWTATQPEFNTNVERGSGRLNIQGGLLAAAQWPSGIYVQWQTGLQYQNLRNWNYSRVSTTFDFGFERTTTSLIIMDYWSLQNSLHLGYAIKKHRWFGGITHQHYLGSRYQLNRTTERQDQETLNNFNTGFGRIRQAILQNWLPSAGYQYSISPAFNVGLQYQFRPAGVSMNTLPTAGAWQLSLQYHLFQSQKQ